MRKTQFKFLKKTHSGGIMVEFALCLPFVIMLLYFVNDSYNYYFWSNKMKNFSYIVTALLQNTYKKADSDLNSSFYTKELNAKEIENICKAAMLSIPLHTNVMKKGFENSLKTSSTEKSKTPMPMVCLLCIKGTSTSGKVKVLWEVDYLLGKAKCFYSGNGSTDNDDNTQGAICQKTGMIIGTQISINKIYPGLEVASEEKKIIVYVYFEPPENLEESDTPQEEKGVSQWLPKGSSIGNFFGFHIIQPSPNKLVTGEKAGYFLNTLAFSPAPGLFSNTLGN